MIIMTPSMSTGLIRFLKTISVKWGVPITFLNKYVSEQFEIIGLDIYLDNHDGTRFQVNGKTKYDRMIIKRKC